MNIKLNATARVKLVKLDADGKEIEVKEQEINLTEEEVAALCHLQQQE